MTPPRPVPPEPEIRDIDEFETLERYVIAYDALAGAVMVLSGVQSGDGFDEVTIEKAMREARHAADGLNAACQELGFNYGAPSARDALFDYRGKPGLVA